MNTSNVYENAVKKFESFRNENSLEHKWPIPLPDLINFIAFMSKMAYAPSTAKSYISGLSFKMKISGLSDTTDNFLISKMLMGMQRLYKRADSRKPITIDLLIRIFYALCYTCSSVYETILFSSCFSLVFFVFLRVSEFAESRMSKRHMLQFSDLKIDETNDLINVSLASSKTDQLGLRTNLEIPKFEIEKICPIQTLKNYMKIRPKIEGPLFCHLNHKSLTRYQISSMLKSTLRFLNINDQDYNTHSFRIGAATSFFMRGKTENEIKAMGRWKSDVYMKYVRIKY